MSAPHDPRAEYEARAGARAATLAARVHDDERAARLRLVAFGLGLVVALLAWRGHLSPVWLAAPAAAFAGLVVLHDRVIRARDAARQAVAFYERGLARIDGAWAGRGQTGDRFRDDAHLYAADLDLFGRGSLFELMSLARTRTGEEMLAHWLMRPADPAEVRDRQDAVAELSPALDLREALWLAGGEAGGRVDTDHLVSWAGAPQVLGPAWRRAVAVVLSVAGVATVIVWAATGEYLPLVATLAIQAVFRYPDRHRVERVLHEAVAPARDLFVFFRLMSRLEAASFESERLRRLRGCLVPAAGHVPASRTISRLERLIEAHDWEHNIVFTLLTAPLLWRTQLAWGIERWRVRHGAEIGAWLRAVGEIEALASIAAYRYERPADPFPRILPAAAESDRRTGVVFEGRSLGHPLLPGFRMVRNDVALADPVRLLVVSGSNMSGKSTLLRTVGINAVLALAGAPVTAEDLQLSPCAIGATLRIQDSLQEGRSRFYAEITRVRAIVEAARGPRPVLFLLDELFHGTNSHDRLAGAAGVLRMLLEAGAAGLVTTHDLALTGVADRLAPRAANVHFEDRLEGGEMRFDYQVKPGPVTRSNALALMRAVGLEVTEGTGNGAHGENGLTRRNGETED